MNWGLEVQYREYTLVPPIDLTAQCQLSRVMALNQPAPTSRTALRREYRQLIRQGNELARLAGELLRDFGYHEAYNGHHIAYEAVTLRMKALRAVLKGWGE